MRTTKSYKYNDITDSFSHFSFMYTVLVKGLLGFKEKVGFKLLQNFYYFKSTLDKSVGLQFSLKSYL